MARQELWTIRASTAAVSRVVHAPELVLPSHGHDAACLHLVVGGVYRERAGRVVLDAPAGWVVYKPRGVEHENRFDARGASSLRLELDDASPALGAVLRRLPSVPMAERVGAIAPIAHRMAAEGAAPDDMSAAILDALVVEALVTMARMREPQRVGVRASVVDRAERMLRDRAAGPVRMGEIAGALGVERTALARAFRARTGRTMGECVREVRADRAAELLAGSALSVAKIAARCGFADQSHLARVFRARFGVSPAAYRARIR
jgi:AraC family transcriptional regulator